MNSEENTENSPENVKIGFIGQGWIGKNYADNFSDRGFSVVRYSLEEEHRHNKDEIANCDIVFIAVPTPTTPEGFDGTIVFDSIPLVGKGKIAVIKSTIPVGFTKEAQALFEDRIVLHSPEFLSVATAREDADNPERNIVGVPNRHEHTEAAAQKVLSILPKAQFSLVADSSEAELIKYAHNVSGFFQVILYNLFYDLGSAHNADWDTLRSAFESNPWMAARYAKPLHKSGRGAGGECFIKDFAQFVRMYEEHVPFDVTGNMLLKALESKNIDLLISTNKDIERLKHTYGDIERFKNE